MLGTVLGLLIALALIYNPIISEDNFNLNIWAFIFAIVATSLLFLKNIASFLAWGPLQKAEQEQTPHIMGLYEKDSHLKYASAWLLIFAIATYFIAINLTLLNSLNKNLLLALWIILFGFSLDCLQYYIKRINDYFNPFKAINMFTQDGIKSIQEEREIDLCNNFDALCEIGVKGIEKTSLSLTTQALYETQSLAKSFLEASKSISHHDEDSQTKAYGIKDKVGFTLFYLFHRLDLINDKALEKGFETICSELISTLGKITLYAAKYDITMAIHPLHYLNLFTQKAVEKGMEDTGLRATFVLLEVSKAILNEVDVTYLEIKETFLAIIGHLDTIAKESFKKDKSINVEVLLQPFLEMKELFQSEKMANHTDTPVILSDLDRIISEYRTLAMVMKTMPPMPNISELTK